MSENFQDTIDRWRTQIAFMQAQRRTQIAFMQAQIDGERKNIAGWIAARDANLARAEAAEARALAAEAEVEHLRNLVLAQPIKEKETP